MTRLSFIKLACIVTAVQGLSAWANAANNHSSQSESARMLQATYNSQLASIRTHSSAGLKVATWNEEHLAYPIDIGCKPRTQQELSAMRTYVEQVDADIFALQEVASKQAVHLLFPEAEWQVYVSPRPDTEGYECRGSGRPSTQQKIAYALRKDIVVNSMEARTEFGLDNPGLRYGLELNVQTDFGNISLLNVHMKSGCFTDNFTRSDREACETFARQAPLLDQWVEQKESEDMPYIVLGDFNHRLSAPYNHLTQQLFDNSNGSQSTLINTGADMIGCHPYYPAPIDHVFVGGMNPAALDFSAKAHDFENMEVDKMLSDHCAVSLNISTRLNQISNAVKWQTTSKEYAFLTQAIYQQATQSIKQSAQGMSNWVVVMDVDETILDNSPYQVDLDRKGLSYTPQTWAQWVKQENAELVPGVAEFMQSVIDMGGKLALITNRDKGLDAYTWRNLMKQKLPISTSNTCLIGKSEPDSNNINGDDIINDKDLRRIQIMTAQADCFSNGGSRDEAFQRALEIVMEVGDNIEDFTSVTQQDAKTDALVESWPSRLVLLPNPMYGSW